MAPLPTQVQPGIRSLQRSTFDMVRLLADKWEGVMVRLRCGEVNWEDGGSGRRKSDIRDQKSGGEEKRGGLLAVDR